MTDPLMPNAQPGGGMEEKRRERALTLAVQSTKDDPTVNKRANILERASAFEKFLQTGDIE